MNLIIKKPIINIQLIKDPFILQNKNQIKIFNTNENYNLLDTILLEPKREIIFNLLGFENFIIYAKKENSNGIYLYNIKEKNKYCIMKNEKTINSIFKLNKKNILIKIIEEKNLEFYLYDIYKNQIINHYKFNVIINDIKIFDNKYFIFYYKKNRISIENKIQNIFTGKFERKYNNRFWCYKKEEKFINELIQLSKELLYYSTYGIIYLNTLDSK